MQAAKWPGRRGWHRQPLSRAAFALASVLLLARPGPTAAASESLESLRKVCKEHGAHEYEQVIWAREHPPVCLSPLPWSFTLRTLARRMLAVRSLGAASCSWRRLAVPAELPAWPTTSPRCPALTLA